MDEPGESEIASSPVYLAISLRAEVTLDAEVDRFGRTSSSCRALFRSAVSCIVVFCAWTVRVQSSKLEHAERDDEKRRKPRVDAGVANREVVRLMLAQLVEAWSRRCGRASRDMLVDS
ncbi:high-affinity glucose transporter [Pseudozyma hubeiensis SY62]|uniref:High-affinity glucose transporter n=1 Tax=Pseudozyma hubeiensis (strain SY62) TaxID=1305764 RepID=R9P448_PSEHS|nr:high-affinity glucose transporter [Pseudozyma hubeiensis SY62]GAC96218.1 high-affinity glucose transporter [Pseudozyma hubeiensis SY62]